MAAMGMNTAFSGLWHFKIDRMMFVILIGLVLCGEAQAVEIAVIANNSYPQNSMTIDILRDIYRGEKTVEGDIRIRPIDYKGGKIKEKFLKKVMGMTLEAYNKHWMKKIFQEGGVPPAIKDSSIGVIEALEEESGGIGYVWIREAVQKDNIKVLLIINEGD